MTTDDLMRQIQETERLAVYRNANEVIVGTQDEIYARRGLINRTTLTKAETGDGIADGHGACVSGGQRGDDFVNGRTLRSNTTPQPSNRGKHMQDNLPATSAPARTLGEFACGLTFEHIPAAVLERPSS